MEQKGNKQTMHLWGEDENPDECPRLVAWLLHPECGTAKSFTITINLSNVLSKEQKGISLETFCEKCGSKTGVTIEWQQ